MVRGMRTAKLMVQRIPDEALLRDIVRVCRTHGSTTNDTYRAHGKFAHASIVTRFGTWRNALRRAGIQTKCTLHAPDADEDDFEPIEKPKARKCLQCGVAIVSINYTCGNCYASNSTAVLADGWEVVAG